MGEPEIVTYCTGPDGAASSLAESFAQAAAERLRFVMANRERFVEAWCAETGILPSEAAIVETFDSTTLTTTVMVRRRDGVPEATEDISAAFERRRREQEKLERLSRQRAVLRREVRRLNEKCAAFAFVVATWRRGGFDAVQSVRDARTLSGCDMWALRQALGLSACEVSNADVIRAAARKLEKDADNG